MGTGSSKGNKKPPLSETGKYNSHLRPDYFRPVDDPTTMMIPIKEKKGGVAPEENKSYDEDFAVRYETEQIEINVFARREGLMMYNYKGTPLEMFGEMAEKAMNPSGKYTGTIAEFMDDIFNNKIRTPQIMVLINREVTEEELPRLKELLSREINDFGKMCLQAAIKMKDSLIIAGRVSSILNKCPVTFIYKGTDFTLEMNVQNK